MAIKIISDDNREPKYELGQRQGNTRLELLRHQLSGIDEQHVFIYADKTEEEGKQRVWLDCGKPEIKLHSNPDIVKFLGNASSTNSNSGVLRTLTRVASRIKSTLEFRAVDEQVLEISAPPGVDLKDEIGRLCANLVQGRGM